MEDTRVRKEGEDSSLGKRGAIKSNSDHQSNKVASKEPSYNFISPENGKKKKRPAKKKLKRKNEGSRVNRRRGQG